MDSLSSTPSPHGREDRQARDMDRYEAVSWWSLHTTDSLLLNFRTLLASTRQLRREITHGDLTKEQIDRRARQVQAEVDDLTAIVVELRKRGHSVDWEE